MDAMNDAVERRIQAAKNVLTCSDHDFPATVAKAVKTSGTDLTAQALLLRVLEQMLAKIDDPDA